jgi:hypothetical protein
MDSGQLEEHVPVAALDAKAESPRKRYVPKPGDYFESRRRYAAA